MEWVEVTGKSVEEAQELALDELGIDEADAEFEVLETPKQGLFGRVRGEARVRARIAPKAPRPKQERPRRKSEGGRSKSRSNKSSGGDRSGSARESGSDDAGAGGSGSASSDQGEPAQGREPKRQAARSTTKERVMMEASEQESVAVEFFTGLSEAIGLETTVTAELSEDNVLQIDIDGSEVGLLIGPGLQTLDALQEIARHVVQREADDREYGKVQVDVAGVRTTRRAALEAFVVTTAERARDEGVTIPFEVMSSNDRKIVHDTIAGLDGVESASEGEEPRRRVVVRPA
ncbi:MAG: Jag N-terminal domain-containing protein [Acidobacteria bacterium]|nr:Jag N-terminal domain-containing protein [Acidobacteriota bacterium]